jgi:3-dehydroquinate synthetase
MVEGDARSVRVVPGGDAGRAYEVVIGRGLAREAGARVRRAVPGAARVFVVWDRALPGEAVAAVRRGLGEAGLSVAGAEVGGGEESKTLGAVEGLLAEMSRARVERGDVVAALGGGVVGDAAGFAAAIYRRGVAWVNLPTTLLAMVDASVGGKTAVNVGVPGSAGGERWRNMAGAFHQPSLVVIDVGLLSSLPAREVRSGLVECVKHALLSADWGDAGLLEWTEGAAGRVLGLDGAALVELVARNVAVKAAVVGADEREAAGAPGGGRQVLNLGHTFAHAIESAAGGAALRHGEAVSLGLVAAARCAARLGVCAAPLAARVERLLGGVIGLPTWSSGLPPAADLLERMHDDKKVAGGRLRLVLPAAEGRVIVVDSPAREAVLWAIESIRRPPVERG